MVQKLKINIKSRISDDHLDLSMSDLDEVPIKEIVSKLTLSLHSNLLVISCYFRPL